jgi:hypothetical protein
MGVILRWLGLIASPNVVEAKANDLVGEYVGHTVPKTRKLMRSAIGKVLFIDEVRPAASLQSSWLVEQLSDACPGHLNFPRLPFPIAAQAYQLITGSGHGNSTFGQEAMDFITQARMSRGQPNQRWERSLAAKITGSAWATAGARSQLSDQIKTRQKASGGVRVQRLYCSVALPVTIAL